jgi:hypothetical protein
MFINELLDVLWAEAQNRAAPAKPYRRDPRLAPGRVIPDPVLRHLQKFRDLVERP